MPANAKLRSNSIDIQKRPRILAQSITVLHKKKSMKLIQSLTSGLVALAMVVAVSAQAAEQGIAKVVNIKGAARYMTTDNPNWRPLKAGAILKPGSVVQTASESYVDVVFNNPNATGSDSTSLSANESSASASASAMNAPDHPKN